MITLLIGCQQFSDDSINGNVARKKGLNIERVVCHVTDSKLIFAGSLQPTDA